jgi:hypothetical protein
MRFWVFQLRDVARVWWGPFIIILGMVVLALVKFKVLYGPWGWLGLVVLGVGLVRSAWQSTGPLTDNVVTRLPGDDDGPTEGGNG